MIFICASILPGIFKPNITYKIGAYGHLYSRISEIKKNKDVDILFLGSSHSYRGFDTRIFKANGFRTFNLGSSSQTPIQTKVLLDKYLSGLNPKLVIYEVYPGTFSGDGVESALDLIANDKNTLSSVQLALTLNHIKVYNTLIYALFQDLFSTNSTFVESKIKGDDTYVPGGYVEKKLSFFKKLNKQPRKWNLNEKQLKVFEEVVSELKSKGIQTLLVYAPIPGSSYNSYTNGVEFDSIMNSHGVYYDFNKMIELDDSLHFYDSHHLNQNGVELFNNKLIEVLSNNKKTF